jgi:hypothetical protein
MDFVSLSPVPDRHPYLDEENMPIFPCCGRTTPPPSTSAPPQTTPVHVPPRSVSPMQMPSGNDNNSPPASPSQRPPSRGTSDFLVVQMRNVSIGGAEQGPAANDAASTTRQESSTHPRALKRSAASEQSGPAVETPVDPDQSHKRRYTPPASPEPEGPVAAKAVKVSLKERMESTPFYQLQERPGQVRMKSNRREYPDKPGVGAGDPSYKVAARVAALYPELGHDQKVKDHSVLVKQDDGSYMLKDVMSGKMTRPESGKPYIFVTMLRNPDDETAEPPDGIPREIRIDRNFNGGNAHAKLAGFAPYVKFVGELRFDDAYRAAEATRRSGTYLPPKGNERVLSGIDCDFTDLPSDREGAAGETAPSQSEPGAVAK